MSGEAAPLDDDSRWVCNLAWKLYAAGLLELYTHPPKLKRTVSQRPVASSLARAQARQGHSVTNLRHGNIDLEDEKTRRLLMLLDGTRDRNQLLKELRESVAGTQISSDELERAEKELEKLTHEYVAEIDRMLQHKEQELLEV